MIPRSLLLLIVATFFAVQASSQYVDMLQGLQSFFQPYQYDLTTRKPDSKRHGSRQQNKNPTNPAIVFPNEDHRSERPKTTVKPNRKTTRPNSSQSARPKPTLQVSRYDSSTPSFKERPRSNENRRPDFSLFDSDNIFFPDDDVTTNSNKKNSQWGNKNANRNPIVTSSPTQFNKNDNLNPVTPSSTQWNNRDRNPTVTSAFGNKNDNRNPDVSNVQWNKNSRNPTVASTQFVNKNDNRNPDVTNAQWGSKNNRNPTVASTQFGNKNDNRNPDVTNVQWNKNSQNPTVASTQFGNKNDNRNPDITSIHKRPSASNNWNKQNGVTTRKPVTIRPGVKPAPVDESRPPITNRPVEPVFPVAEDGPELEVGPDEDDMSSAQKRRYLAKAEQMCESYKALKVRKIVALPLVPSPEAVEFNVSDCTPINVPLIIGGKVSSIEEFPHMSLVGWKKVQGPGYSWKCGGSLISDQYVLTAGHCTYHEKDYNVVSGPPHAVQLGSTFVDGPGAVVVRSASVIRHPKYKQRRSYYDVALIKLASRVTFSDSIRPACLGVPPPVGKPIIATGWGRTEFGGDQSLELRSVSLPIWDMQECKEIWGTSLKLPNGPSSDSHVCAGERSGGKDTCQGDSGGPAQVQDGCIWRVVAVTSSGRSCGAPDTPALYATVPRVFVAAEVFGKHTLDNRNVNEINYNQPTMNNRNTNLQNNFNQNNQNHRVNVNSQNNYNTQSSWNTNQNNPNQQNNNRNTNQNNNEQYTYSQNIYQQTTNNLNNQNRNPPQLYQVSTNNYNQNKNNQNNYNEATTRNPNQGFNYQNSYSQNSNNGNPNSNNPNQYYNQNGYVTEGWNQNYNRDIYDYNLNNEYRVTERPWWGRQSF